MNLLLSFCHVCLILSELRMKEKMKKKNMAAITAVKTMIDSTLPIVCMYFTFT